MLYKFSCENFYSYKDKTEISFVATANSINDDRFFSSPLGQPLTKVMCVVGPNASGKTHLLEALQFISGFTAKSFHADPENLIPVSQHYSHTDEPSNFSCEFEVNNNIYKYELSLTPKRVLEERLLIKNKSTWPKVFSRKWDGNTYKYDLPKMPLERSQAQKIRPNASLISTARQYDIDIAKEICDYMNRIYDHEQYLGSFFQLPRAAKFFHQNPDTHSQAVDILKCFDNSLSDIELKETKSIDEESGKERKSVFPYGIHKPKRNKAVEVIFFEEAGGLRAVYSMLPPILNALNNGGIAVIDEIEANLHPMMLEPLINLFYSQETNPRNAQLFFTCHAPHILSSLDQQQIILTEKYDIHYSDAWRLCSVKGVHSRDNFYKKYMAGAYGATPDA